MTVELGPWEGAQFLVPTSNRDFFSASIYGTFRALMVTESRFYKPSKIPSTRRSVLFEVIYYTATALEMYQNLIKITSNTIYIVAFSGAVKPPCKIHFNTQWGGGNPPAPWYLWLCSIVAHDGKNNYVL